MRQPSFVLAVALFAVVGSATPQFPATPAPGMVNYIEGQAQAGGQALEPGMVVKAGQTLITEADGKVELLLTPGVFLRVGGDSRVVMNAATPASIEIQVERGRALLEVAQIDPRTKLRVNLNGAIVHLATSGLYDFDQAQNQFRVFDGIADVAAYGMRISLKSGRWLDLNHEDLLVSSAFDATPDSQDDLYQWSSLRSAYLAEANVSAAESPNMAPPAQGGEWAYDPSYESYTYVPNDGIAYSPFGWGFYSPILVYRAPIVVTPGPGHRFHVDPGKWGPGPHYAVTHPGPRSPQVPPGYRHVETPGARFTPAPEEAVNAGDNAVENAGENGRNHSGNNRTQPVMGYTAGGRQGRNGVQPPASGTMAAPSTPVNGFRENTRPRPSGDTGVNESARHGGTPAGAPAGAVDNYRRAAPVQSFHPAPVASYNPAPVVHVAPPSTPAPVMHAAPTPAAQPAPAAAPARSGGESRRP